MKRFSKTPTLAVLAIAGLSGCDPAMFGLQPTDPNSAASQETVRIVARDVEAPEVFQKRSNARWDGRPTLGGVWVSHPSIEAPERAIIRNPANNQFVVGGLYPGDIQSGGIEFALSSEAATALGIPAGAIQPVDVTALRPENPAEVAPARETATPAPQAPAPATSPATNAPAPLGLDTPLTPQARPNQQPAPAPAATTNGPLPSKPYVQIGIFSVEANANATAKALNASGISTKVSKLEINGKPFWRVVAGPAKSESEKQSLLKKIKARGFGDAYFVSS